MKALLVIDIDHGNNWKPSDVENDPVRKSVAENITEILAEWRARNELIIFVSLIFGDVSITGQEVQCHYQTGNCLVCDRPSNERLAAFLNHRHDLNFEPAFIKSYTNAFNNKNLAEYLRRHGINKITLIGCNRDACVQDTAAGGVKSGFEVALLAKGVYPKFAHMEADASWWIHGVKKVAGISQDAEAPIEVIF